MKMSYSDVTGLLIAAGYSGRMGKFKPLLTYKDNSFIGNIVLKLDHICNKIIVVTGFNADEVEQNVGQLYINGEIEFALNPDYDKGMYTSLQAGLLIAKDSDWILYHFVDQPGLSEKFYSDFISQIDDQYNWIQPTFKEQNGHPILIHKTLFELILTASGKSSLREISKNTIVKKKYWDCGFKEVLHDVDTEEDYYRLQ